MTMKSILYSILPFFPIVFYISLDLVIVELIVLALTVLIMIICVYGFKIQIVPIKVHNVLHVIAIPMVIIWLGMNWVNDNDNIQTVEIENDIQTITISESDEPISEPEVMYDVSSNNKAPIVNVNAYESKDDKLMKQGVWYDKATGLYWDRCSVGQKWDGETCQGKALELTWQDAQNYVETFTNQQAQGGFSDWRVPTIEELSSIFYCSEGWATVKAGGWGETKLTEKGLMPVVSVPSHGGQEVKIPAGCGKESKNPTINKRLIITDSGLFNNNVYWSSSTDVNFKYSAWTVGFKAGVGIDTYNKYGSFYVRAVRSD